MRKITMWSAWLWLILAAQSALAEKINIKQFQAGDVISAADVNSNFMALAEAVQQLQQQVAELQKQNKALIEENRALKNSLANPQAKTVEPEKQASTPASTNSSKTPKYRLRSEPKTVSETEVFFLFNPDTIRYIENDFDAQGDIVIDYATGLMWQKAGSVGITYIKANAYIQNLNQKKFAGYNDWRLPTIEELFSLVKEQSVKGVYLDPIFDVTQHRCWSSDSPWIVSFSMPGIIVQQANTNNCIRAVRSIRR